MFFIILLTGYIFGYLIIKLNGNYRKLVLWTGIILIFFPLLSFKLSHYYFFKELILGENYSGYLNSVIGLSFYTFVVLGYVIEVYRETYSYHPKFSDFLTYVSFFPCIIAGPIEKPQNLLKQIENNTLTFDENNISNGLKFILLGIIKKVLIAEKLNSVVSNIFDNYWKFEGIIFVIAVFLYAIQIYCDFSGYSDIALGIARTFGIRVTNNFNFPYSAKSISDFWKRWHISLSVWLRDYIFLPLAYLLHKKIKIFNKQKTKELVIYTVTTIITMLICGFWHGGSLNFLIWGLILGVYMSVSNFTRKFRRRFYKRINFLPSHIKEKNRVFITFILVCIPWVFFRSENINQAWYILTKSFNGFHFEIIKNVFNNTYNLILLIVIINLYFLIQFILKREYFKKKFLEFPFWMKWIIYYIVIFIILYYGNFEATKFIYSRF